MTNSEFYFKSKKKAEEYESNFIKHFLISPTGLGMQKILRNFNNQERKERSVNNEK